MCVCVCVCVLGGGSETYGVRGNNNACGVCLCACVGESV